MGLGLGVVRLDDLNLAVGLRLEERSEADREGSKRLRGAAGEERATCAGGDGGECGERAYGDEDGGDGGHCFRVLRCEEAQSLRGVQKPRRGVRNFSG